MTINSSLNGIRSALNSNNVKANNIANINSRGYKSRRSIQSEMGGNGPVINAVSKDFTQGALRITGQSSDIAIKGIGFFEVEDPAGGKLFTRTIKLQRNSDGRLSDGRGNRIAGIEMPAEGGKDIIVQRDGSVFCRDNKGNEIQIGKLLVVNFTNPQGLKATGGGYFHATSNSGHPAAQKSGIEVLQGVEEMSNVDLAEQITGQMMDETAVKANVKALKTQDRMLGEIVDLQG